MGSVSTQTDTARGFARSQAHTEEQTIFTPAELSPFVSGEGESLEHFTLLLQTFDKQKASNFSKYSLSNALSGKEHLNKI